MSNGEVNFLELPDQADLESFFGTAASAASPSDGCWTYEFRDAGGSSLRVCLDIFLRSIATEVSMDGSPLVSVVHEGAVRVRRLGDQLVCEFDEGALRTELRIGVDAGIRVSWSSLRVS